MLVLLVLLVLLENCTTDKRVERKRTVVNLMLVRK